MFEKYNYITSNLSYALPFVKFRADTISQALYYCLYA